MSFTGVKPRGRLSGMNTVAAKYGLRNARGLWFSKGSGTFWLADWTWLPDPTYPFETWDLAEAARLTLDYPGETQVVKEGDP